MIHFSSNKGDHLQIITEDYWYQAHKLRFLLKNLVNRGNTVIAVEHDENFMRAADYIIDLGPDAGICGGTVSFKAASTTLRPVNYREPHHI